MPIRGNATLRAALTPARTGVAALAVAAAVLMTTLGGWDPGGPGRPDRPRPVRQAHGPERDIPLAPGCDEKNPARSLQHPSAEDGPAVRAIARSGKIVIGVDQNTYHWGYRDPASKQLQGFDIELARTLVKEIFGADFTVEFKAVATNDRIDALKGHDIDMVVRTMTIDCRRQSEVAFSTAYFGAQQKILAGKETPVGSAGDLRGKKVCAAEESTGSKWVKEHLPGARLVQVPNQLDCLVRLQLGEAVAVVTDDTLAAAQAAQDPTVQVKRYPEDSAVEPYGVAMRKEDTDLVARVNQVLDTYRDGGGWEAARKRWLAKDGLAVTEPPAAQYASEG
ncbi:glutamate ABC transporter substrate-binding protein [Streptomyces sp. NPDC091266]|uniref:glutamate ABC transporter substrate-binding protein n=1 Tax=Streptomyces sp. NPDC091266 TaxID=3365978 RepID=UPI003830E0DA